MKSATACFTFASVSALSAAVPSSQSDDIEDLKMMVKALRKTVAEQNARIAALEKQQRPTPAPAVKAFPMARTNTTTRLSIPTAELPVGAVPKGRAAVRDTDDLAGLQQAAPRPHNVPLDPALKGFIAIPDTDTIFKIGGSARIDAIADLANNGNPNQFVPSTIPVPGEHGSDGHERSTLHAKGTRLSLELRRPVPFDSTLRLYSEYDFFDDSISNSMKFRVRHFYGQAWNFLIGQTFSAFMDPDAFPDVVDYQGPNGSINRRQPQIRYTLPVYEGSSKMQLFASIEQPDSKIDTSADEFASSASPINHVPEGVVGARWEGPAGHLQGSVLFRELSFETDRGRKENTFGWGVSLAGALNVFEKDKLSAQVSYGEGIARYVNDLSGESLDAALHHGHFDAIPVFAAMAGYTHHWNDRWRTTISGGYVHADAPESLGRLAIDNTFYASANLMWHPSTSFRMGLEYLYGHKETLDNSEAEAHRLNFVIRYDLVR
jgi:hypothetical protein